MKGSTVKRKQSHQPAAKKNRQQQQKLKQSSLRAEATTSSRRCGSALCCGSSRLSISSNVSNSSSSSEGVLRGSQQLEYRPSSYYSDYAQYGVVQSRLDQMIAGAGGANVRPRGSGRTCIVLVAVDKSSCDPKGDFRRSIAEVITSKRLEEPKELRSLLNCYMAMNDPELRWVILEAFHEVCTNLFVCSSSSSSSSSNHQLLYYY